MKDYLSSLLRHAFTALAGLGGLLVSINLIDPADAPAVDAAGGTLASALVVILTAVIGRLLITLGAKIFRIGAGENGEKNNGGGVGTLPLWIVGTAAALMGALPSCSSIPAGTPVTFSLIAPDGAVSYSAKGGLSVSAIVRPEK